MFPPHLVYERSREVIGHPIFIDLQFSRKISGQQVHCARGAALFLGLGALLGSFIILVILGLPLGSAGRSGARSRPCPPS